MEDKRTALAVFLCFAVILVYSELVLAPKMRARTPVAAQSTAATPPSAQGGVIQQPPVAGSAASVTALTPNVQSTATGHPSVAELDSSPATIIQTNETAITISHLGGKIRSYKLLHYKDHIGAEDTLDMVYHGDTALLPGTAYVGALSDERVLYTLSAVSPDVANVGNTITLPADKEVTITLTGMLTPQGPTITKSYKVGPTPYLLSTTISLDKPLSDVSRIWFEWALHLNQAGSRDKLSTGFILLSDATKIEHVAMQDVTTASSDHVTNKWAAVTDKYFLAALIPTVSANNTRIGKGDNEVYSVRVSGDPTKATFSLYVGPKEPARLENAGFELRRSVDLGTFTVVAGPLLVAIRFLHSLFGNYGLAIILLTLLIKSLFLPLTKASFHSMRKMQEIAPEMKTLKDQIKDPTELNRAVLELYKKKGVNPMGGCLPMLVQLPVFLGLYNALLNAIELRHAPFALWIKDLSSPEGLEIFGMHIPVMVLIMGASMFYQQSTSPQTGDPQQQKIMKFMPLMFTAMFIIYPMPSGLVLYWLVNNTISIIQQVYLRKDKKASPYAATAIASAVIFSFGYVLTLI